MASTEDIDPREELIALVGDAHRHLEWLQAAGETTLARGTDAPGALTQPRSERTQAHAQASSPAPPLSSPSPIVRPAFLGGGKPAPSSPPRVAPESSARAPASPPIPPEPPVRRSAPPPLQPAQAVASAPSAASPSPSRPSMSPDERLRVIRAELGACRRCKLCETRSTIVYGQGSAVADVVFIGEAPEESEDRSGVPFVGEAGQMLTRMIVGMGLTRDDVYVTTIVKCRTPNDRRVEPDEIAACRPFYEQQLRAIRPKVIVALGGKAAQALLRTDRSITELRHKWGEWEGIAVMPTFHPSYLLRAPQQKRAAWEDLKLVMERLGLSGR